MPSIHNKLKRPIVVPLPGGKKLRLGPLQTGQVTPKALEHPPLKKLVEAGDVEVTVADQRSGNRDGGKGKGPGRGRTPTGGVHHVGDQ